MTGRTHQRGRDTANAILFPVVISVSMSAPLPVFIKLSTTIIALMLTHAGTGFGTDFTDMDANAVTSLPAKDPMAAKYTADKFYFSVACLIQATVKAAGGSHRSKHLHVDSMPFWLFFLPALIVMLFQIRHPYFFVTIFPCLCFFFGAAGGSWMHLFLDKLCFEGTFLSYNADRTSAFVLEGLRHTYETYGKTGGDWEDHVNEKMKVWNRRLVRTTIVLFIFGTFGITPFTLMHVVKSLINMGSKFF